MKIGNAPDHSHAALNQNAENQALSYAYEGKVIGVNPEDSTVDVRLYNGQILKRVRVLFNSANTVAGFRYLSSITNNAPVNSSSGTLDDGTLTGISDTLATIIYIQGNTIAPRVIGFSFPKNAQMHINEQGLAMFRHESGVYSLIDKNGHHETHYPDGSYLIVAQDTTPRTLTSSGQTWNTPTRPPVNFIFKHSSGSYISIGTDGTVSIKGKTTAQSW